jgi:hypothetical protein
MLCVPAAAVEPPSSACPVDNTSNSTTPVRSFRAALGRGATVRAKIKIFAPGAVARQTITFKP